MRSVALLVINPHSRRGGEALPVVKAAMEKHGLAIREAPDVKPGELSGVLEKMAGEVDRIVVGGGDGSLNAALPAVLASGLPLGIVPLGTANDLARTLGLPLDPAEAVAVIAGGATRRIDAGEANGHPFFNVASIGFGVDLTRALSRDAKKRWGVLGYAVAGFRTLQRMRRFTVIIEADGETHRSRTIHLAVGNGRHYGGGMTVSESAAIDDGRLNVYSLEVRRMWRLLALLPAMRRGNHGKWEEVRTLSGKDITITTHRPRSVNTDGEITTRTPLRIRVLPGAVTVFVPAAGKGPEATPPGR